MNEALFRARELLEEEESETVKAKSGDDFRAGW